MKRLTEKQKAVFDWIQSYVVKNGYAPVQKEIAENTCIRHQANVRLYLKLIEKKGYLRFNPSVPRGITILQENES
jgi:repressor LexA